MKLGPNHTLTADSNGFTLAYNKEGAINPKTNRPSVTRKITYHPSLEKALEAYLNHVGLLGIQAEIGIEDLHKCIVDAREFISTALNPFTT